MRINLYVLQGRCGTDTLGTSLHLNHKDAHKAMSGAYKGFKSEWDGHYEPGTGIGRYDATIVTSGDWYEWFITKFTLLIKNGKVSIIKKSEDEL